MQVNSHNEYVYIGIGSNIEPEINIPEALRKMNNYMKIYNISPVFITSPIGTTEKQPDFYNCVIQTKLKISTTPYDLKFNILRKIEIELKRIRSEDKYAPRTIDLDILLFHDFIINEKDLIIPDPDIFSRDFLFAGLLYLNPDIIIYPQKVPLRLLIDKYEINKIKIHCNFTNKLWKEFIHEH